MEEEKKEKPKRFGILNQFARLVCSNFSAFASYKAHNLFSFGSFFFPSFSSLDINRNPDNFLHQFCHRAHRASPFACSVALMSLNSGMKSITNFQAAFYSQCFCFFFFLIILFNFFIFSGKFTVDLFNTFTEKYGRTETFQFITYST